jgi:2-polyprenyl-3-methyl-5-hydroxy-6-metoxy-1,4-benzoquinol methylase
MTDMQTEQGRPAPRYDFKTIDLDSGSVHADVVRLAGESARVLELGTATGYMSRALVERGCTVVGIEFNPKMAEQASEFCERMIVGDLDALDIEGELGEDRFDAIIAADVLEHLKDPLTLLKRLRPLLKPDGCFVISIPNIAHGSVRLALLSGQFNYQDIGLLDATHLRFFTQETLAQLLDEAELGMAELHRHELNLDASEVPFDADAVSPQMREQLESDPEARTYQFVVKAIPMEREGLRELQRQLREVAELRLKAERVAELEKALAEIGGREGGLRRALIEAHDQLLRRDAELARMHNEAQILQVRLDGILNSPPGRLYAVLRRLPGLRSLDRRRKAGVDAALTKHTDPSA